MPGSESLRNIPSVSRVIDEMVQRGWESKAPRSLITHVTRNTLEECRARMRHGDEPNGAPTLGSLANEIEIRLLARMRPPLRPAINATGILLHTGLGRAPLIPDVADMVREVASGYAPVEIDIESGKRGKRSLVVREILCELTGAESATVVNNGAAALMLSLAALAKGREVIVSRGELIEIGGSFRLPDVIEAGGAQLHEIGTTNRTRARDFERAINVNTAVLLKVHPSNYRVEGFTDEVTIKDLAAIGRKHDIPVVHDVGSGLLNDALRFGPLDDEPDVRSSIADGADLAMFSGDKVLGGPQAGIIVGRRDLVQAIEAHPMMRAMRIDKIMLAALGMTLQVYRDPERALTTIPALARARVSCESLRERAKAILTSIEASESGFKITTVDSTAYLGGGTTPAMAIPSVGLHLDPAGTMSEADLATRLRQQDPPIFARTQGGAVILDLRSIPTTDDAMLASSLTSILSVADQDFAG